MEGALKFSFRRTQSGGLADGFADEEGAIWSVIAFEILHQRET